MKLHVPCQYQLVFTAFSFMKHGGTSVKAQSSHFAYILDSSRSITGVAGTKFGRQVAFSSDGSKIIISSEFSNGSDGQFYGYFDDGTTWTLYNDPGVAGKKGSDEQFGKYVDVSDDGNIVATGARYHNGGHNNNGYATIWSYDGMIWSQLGSSKKGDRDGANYGLHVKISDDGSRFVTGGVKHLGTRGAAQIFLLIMSLWIGINLGQI